MIRGVLKKEALISIVIVKEGHKKPACFAVRRDDRPFGGLPRLVHINEQRWRRRPLRVYVLDNAVQCALQCKVQRRINANGVIILGLGVAPDKLG